MDRGTRLVCAVQTRTSGQEPLLLRALNGEQVERPPVWMMRQAGRYMKVGPPFLTSAMCMTPIVTGHGGQEIVGARWHVQHSVLL